MPVGDVCGTQCHEFRTKLISAIVIWYDSTATSRSPGTVSGLGTLGPNLHGQVVWSDCVLKGPWPMPTAGRGVLVSVL